MTCLSQSQIIADHSALAAASFSVLAQMDAASHYESDSASSWYAGCGKVDGFFSPTIPSPGARPTDVVEHLLNWNHPTWTWVTEPDQWELSLELWQSGFRVQDHLSLMRRDLYSEDVDPLLDGDLVRPEDFEELRGLYRNYFRSVGDPLSDVMYFGRDQVLTSDSVDAVMVRDKGVAAAGAMAVSFEGLSMIFRVLTLPEHRGKGLGRRAMSALLSRLSSRGQSEVLLQATSPGRPLYLRMGFTDEAHISLWENN